MNITTIYKLEPVTDNPNFEGLATLEYDPSLLGRRNITADFFPESRDDWNWEIEKLSPIWQPLQTTGRVRSFNDGPFINLAIPAFSKRAAEGLRDLLTPTVLHFPPSPGSRGDRWLGRQEMQRLSSLLGSSRPFCPFASRT